QESGLSAFTLTDEQIEMIWKYLGGSMFEISYILGELIPLAKNKCVETESIQKEIDRLISMNEGKLSFYASINQGKRLLFRDILSVHQQKEMFRIDDLESLVEKGFYDETGLINELSNLVRMNILAFYPTTAHYMLQGNSMYYGLEKYINRVFSDNNQ
ncbi:MAG: hypothetical protein OMM_15310, partial [Candidatus Magnetoglobus multicellularis str. Araruama]